MASSTLRRNPAIGVHKYEGAGRGGQFDTENGSFSFTAAQNDGFMSSCSPKETPRRDCCTPPPHAFPSRPFSCLLPLRSFSLCSCFSPSPPPFLDFSFLLFFFCSFLYLLCTIIYSSTVSSTDSFPFSLLPPSLTISCCFSSHYHLLFSLSFLLPAFL